MKLECDYIVHHPLGGASYIFENNLIDYINYKLVKKNIIISIGAQPNSSPHFGTLCVFSLAFSLAKKLKEKNKYLNVSVLFEVVDTAPSETLVINDISYQEDLKNSKKMKDSMEDFKEILDYYSKKEKIKYSIRKQSEFNNHKEIKDIIKSIIDNEDKIKYLLDPKGNRLRIRSTCPKCGLVDKEGINTSIKDNKLICLCPIHGKYEVDLINETKKLEYNTPLRNLIRGILYGIINNSKEYDYEYIRITGGDYSGFYQEELLYKVSSILGYNCNNLPMILYCPQILDWSGAKLSKSLYVAKDAYKYLPKYLMNYKGLKEEYGDIGLSIIHNESNSWLEEPYKLFRNYSIYYFMKLFEEKMNIK